MSSLKIYKDKDSQATVISNHFIDEYMKDANDAQLKVYLYLLRMMSANRSTSISDIADLFNHTEKDVMRALKYWEKTHLLALDFDESKNLSGIHLLDPEISSSGKANSSTNVLSFIQKNSEEDITPKKVAEPVKEVKTESPTVSIVEHVTEPVFEPEKAEIEKPSYSADQLRDFQKNDEISELLFIAEQYMKKPLSNQDMKTILFFYDRLQFSSDLIDYLIQYCVEKEKRDFRYIEKVALGWHAEGINSPKQAISYVKKYDKNVNTIMKALGKATTPSPKELEYITRWTKSFGFSLDIITEACDRTTLAVQNHRFEYCDVILEKWFQKQVHSKQDIKALDESYNRSRQTQTTTSKNNNKFNQFASNDYDFQALEKEILSN